MAAKDIAMFPGDNPLLDFSDLPRFASIRASHVRGAIETLLAESRALIPELEQAHTPATWEGFVQPLEAANEHLSRAWGTVGHLHAVLDSPELREVYGAVQPGVVQFYTELGQNVALFEKYKTLRASPEFGVLSRAQRKIVDNEIRDFRLSGAELPGEAKKRLASIQEELASLSTRFSENVLDATNAFTVYLEDRSELVGIPQDVVAVARAAAAADGRPGWKLTLQAPCYHAIIQYADSRSLREVMYQGYATRASAEFEAALARKVAYERRVCRSSESSGRRAPRSMNGTTRASSTAFSSCAGSRHCCSATSITRSCRWSENGRFSAAGTRIPERSCRQGAALCATRL